MIWLLFISPLLVPLTIYVAARRGFHWTMWMAALAAGIGAGGCGAFIGAAASAMSTAEQPNLAMLKGFGAGLLAGLAIAGLCVAAEIGWTGLRARKANGSADR